jgi:nucleotide-binding universal stress UspA family protein
MKLLLPTDGSECAEKTLEWASRMFDKKQTQYYLLHVVSAIPELSIQDYEVEDTLHLLKRARKTLEQAGCTVAAADYAFGDEVMQICDYAEEQAIDQVIIGSHGRRGFAKFLLGSVGVAVLENCTRPVIVYRPVEAKPEKPVSGNPVLATNTALEA